MSAGNLFTSDLFGVIQMTAAIDKLPSVPGKLGRMGLFKPMSISTIDFWVEERQGKLYVLPTAVRGSQGMPNAATQSKGTRKGRTFRVPHVPQWDAVYAEAYQGVRQFGTDDQVESPAAAVNDALERMKANHETTWERHRMGALRGLILDADGSTIYDLYSEFGVSKATVEWNFYDSGNYDQAKPSQIMIQNCLNLKRQMKRLMGETPYKGIGLICGNDLFDSFVQHSTIRRAYELWQSNDWARTVHDDENDGFTFGDITFYNYDDFIGATDLMDHDKGVAFPIGAPDLFQEVAAPADFMETVNTKGKTLYAKQEPMKWDKGVEIHTQSNVLYMCNRPSVLVEVTAVIES